MNDDLSWEQIRDTIRAVKAVQPKVRIESIRVHSREELELLQSIFPPPTKDLPSTVAMTDARLGLLNGVPVYIDEEVPKGAIRTCYGDGTSSDQVAFKEEAE